MVARSWRWLAGLVVLAATGVLVTLSLAFHDARVGTSFDYSVTRRLRAALGPTASRAFLHLSEPAMVTTLLVLVAVAAAALRKWRIATFAAVSPVAAIIVTEVVLKPLVNRQLTFSALNVVYTTGGAFPSGHETALTTLTAELAVLALRTGLRARWRSAVVALLAVWTLGGAIGLTRNYFHYVTDTLGGACVAIAVVVSVALVVDAVADRRQLTCRS